MSNFFYFEEDKESVYVNPPSFSESNPFKVRCYGGSSWFSISGYTHSGLSVTIPDIVLTFPKGEYEVSINRELKGKNDYCFLKSVDGEKTIVLHKDPILVTVEKQTEFLIVFEFFGTTHYLYGDYYTKQEDYGKDYEILVNLISGGLYERESGTIALKGDLNSDGRIDYQDIALSVLKMRGVSGVANDFNSDVNSDGVVDAVDATLLRKYLLGKEFFW